MFAAAVATLTQGVDALADIDPAGWDRRTVAGCSTYSKPTASAVDSGQSHRGASRREVGRPTVMAKAIADAIRVTPAEVRRRLRDAEQSRPAIDIDR